MIKQYTDVNNPNTVKILEDIVSSDMGTKDVEHCDYNSTSEVLKIYFTSDLQSGDEGILDDIVNNNLNYTRKKFKINESFKDPSDININFFGLHKEELINDLGFLYQVNYYKNLSSGDNFSDLAVRDEYQYFTNEYDIATHRIETITWYLEDDTVGAIKQITKYYDLQGAVVEGVRRRANLIEKAKAYLLENVEGYHSVSGEPTLPNSYYLYTLCKNEIELYIAGMKPYLVEFFENTEEPYVTEEIRTGVLDIIKYWSG